MANIDFLDKISKLIENDEAALAIEEKLGEIAVLPDAGTASDRAKAVADWAETHFPEIVKNKKTKIRELALAAMPELPPASQPPVSSAPPQEPGPEAPTQSSKNDTIMVLANAKVTAYDGEFYDPTQDEGHRNIGKKPVQVKKTIFILQKLANNEIVEV
jgi:hypothetical protein